MEPETQAVIDKIAAHYSSPDEALNRCPIAHGDLINAPAATGVSNVQRIEVGGAAKGDLSSFRGQLSRLQRISELEGVTAQFWYAANTPQAVIDFAVSKLGQANVIPIPGGI